MDIGLGIPQIGHFADPALTHEAAQRAEAIGFSSLWAFDRMLTPVAPRSAYPATADGLLPPEMGIMLDPIVTLTVAATATERVRLGTSVLVAPWYPPVLLARSLATLDLVSKGRLTVGLGLGWSLDEFEAVGAPMHHLGNRMEEILEVLHMVWNHDVVDIETTGETIKPSRIGLRPAQPAGPPIVMGAYSPAGFERIARRGAGWNPAGIPMTMAMDIWKSIVATAQRYGRDTTSMRLVVRANVKLTDVAISGDARPDFVGSFAQVRDDVRRAYDFGIDDLIVELQGTTKTVDEMLDVAVGLAEPELAFA